MALLAKQRPTPVPESSLLKALTGASPGAGAEGCRAGVVGLLVSAMGKDLRMFGALG